MYMFQWGVILARDQPCTCIRMGCKHLVHTDLIRRKFFSGARVATCPDRFHLAAPEEQRRRVGFCILQETSTASNSCKSTERSGPTPCTGSFCRRILHCSFPIAAPRPWGVVVRRCPGPYRSQLNPNPGRSVGPGFLARGEGYEGITGSM